MNFLKKIIGLSMAMVMAFGGFAANAVKFVNKTTEEFVEISCNDDYWYDICSFLGVYSYFKHAYETKCIEKSEWLKLILKVDDTKVNDYVNNNLKFIFKARANKIDDTKINDYINNSQRLKEFFEKNEYKADFPKFDTTYWIIERGDLNSYKKEAIIFDHFLSLVKENYDLFVDFKNPFVKISDINLIIN